MKTPAEWTRLVLADYERSGHPEEQIAKGILAAQSDARAGMVPEAELAELRRELERTAVAVRLAAGPSDMKAAATHIEVSVFSQNFRDCLAHIERLQAQREAEMAKAWCDGRDAALDAIDEVGEGDYWTDRPRHVK